MAALSARYRYTLCVVVVISLFFSLRFLHQEYRTKTIPPELPLVAPDSPPLIDEPPSIPPIPLEPPESSEPTVSPEPSEPAISPEPSEPTISPQPSEPTVSPPFPIYKTITHHPVFPIKEYFPLAAAAKSPSDLPPLPPWNRPPAVHVAEVTPLFIGFTRNWPLLQQAVVGYITAGWPPEDIYVVENTGTMDSNKHGRLSLQNPFYLDHHRLTNIFGVNIIVTPALLSFAQLQNFYLFQAINNRYPTYFWSHMDVLPQSAEHREPYKSFYRRCVDIVQQSLAKGYARDEEGREGRWAIRYLSYDWLTLVNTATNVELGGWDTMISYYGTDCDMYDRMRMHGLETATADAGKVYDMGTSLENLEVLYRLKPNETEEASPSAQADTPEKTSKGDVRVDRRGIEYDKRNSTHWKTLQDDLKAMQQEKVHGALSRNSWQVQQRGGEGEPFYRDIDGFEEALEITIKAGEAVYQAKWGTKRCDLRNAGLKAGDEWKVVKGA